MNETELRALLERSPTIAVVGASTHPAKAAHRIPAILIEAGFTVIPVHPTATEILGQRAYPTLAEIPVPVDLVDVFRPAAETPGIARQAVEIGAPALWLQLGIVSAEAAEIASSAGLDYVEDACTGALVDRLGIRPRREG
ncbi:CoA-binding protein [Agrococcus sp. KRD186]|uniref:CoA-binding protein n=1 Tax=Agrococcus sp. KRD186 TaxID=2729730 RepID=UPI0019D31D61|nr:CoA-binding protein [Agrococcus sp. KRD186]